MTVNASLGMTVNASLGMTVNASPGMTLSQTYKKGARSCPDAYSVT
jgi:hypothetical protein